MKQILYISPFSHIGGGEISLLTILTNLDRKRFTPHLICYEDGPFVKKARSLGFKVSIFKRGQFYTDPFLIMRLIWYIKRNGINLVHVNSLDIRAGLAAWYSGVPFIGHLRVIIFFTWRDYFFTRLAKQVISVSNAVTKSFCEAFPAARKVFVVISNAVEVPAVVKPAPLREEFGLPPRTYLVGAIGRIDPWKGYEYLIDAAARITRITPHVYFVLIGGPSKTNPTEQHYLEMLKKRVARAAIVDRFIFTGFIDNPLNVIAACDIIAIPSYSLGRYGGKITEGFGRVAAEAMAVGVPVVASNIGGLSEIVEDGKTGLLVPPQNSDALYRAILRIIGDKNLKELLGRNGRAKFESLYTVEQQRSALESLYESVLSGKT